MSIADFPTSFRDPVRIDHRGQRLIGQIVPSQPGSGEGNETRYRRKLRNVQKLILDEAGRRGAWRNGRQPERSTQEPERPMRVLRMRDGPPGAGARVFIFPQGRLSAEWAPSRTKAGIFNAQRNRL